MRKTSFIIALASLAFISQAAHAENYSFKLNNTTKQKMVKLQVSQDGKTWGDFDLGSGIAAGESAKLVWNESTNGQNCQQKVKAMYADGAESEVADFDFCEADLELDF